MRGFLYKYKYCWADYSTGIHIKHTYCTRINEFQIQIQKNMVRTVDCVCLEPTAKSEPMYDIYFTP